MPAPWPTTPPTAADRAAYADAEPRAYWLEPAVEPAPALTGRADADLCIVGAGFTGLWAALRAKTLDPGRDVVVLEAETAGFGASGRNGGFAVSSLTHGIGNGMARFPREMDVLERLGDENLAGLRADVARLAIDCDLEPTGELTVAFNDRVAAELDEEAELLERFGRRVERFDAAGVQAEIASPLYRGGVWDRSGAVMLDPGKLARGLRAAALDAGVRLHEHTPAAALRDAPGGVDVLATQGRVRARRVLLATSAFPPLLRAIRHHVAPVYDYVLLTEPLSRAQRASLRWVRRQGVGEAANQFHYSRLTADDHLLWGGYDAIYRPGGPVGPALDEHDATFARLSQQLFVAYPQLEGVRFSHRWGGAIDTSSRFSVFFGTAHRGRVAYAVGYTGLGVAATRFGAHTALDLLDGRETEVTRLRYVRRRPVPFPPEPLRTAVIALTRNRLAAADRADGRHGLWLRTLDRLGLGFDS